MYWIVEDVSKCCLQINKVVDQKMLNKICDLSARESCTEYRNEKENIASKVFEKLHEWS